MPRAGLERACARRRSIAGTEMDAPGRWQSSSTGTALRHVGRDEERQRTSPPKGGAPPLLTTAHEPFPATHLGPISSRGLAPAVFAVAVVVSFAGVVESSRSCRVEPSQRFSHPMILLHFLHLPAPFPSPFFLSLPRRRFHLRARGTYHFGCVMRRKSWGSRESFSGVAGERGGIWRGGEWMSVASESQSGAGGACALQWWETSTARQQQVGSPPVSPRALLRPACSISHPHFPFPLHFSPSLDTTQFRSSPITPKSRCGTLGGRFFTPQSRGFPVLSVCLLPFFM